MTREVEDEGGGDIDESEQDDEQMWTSLFSRLISITYISDSPPLDGVIMTEEAHTTEPSTTHHNSTDGIEPPSSLKSSDN